jgi:hypothetical protein
LAVANRNQVAQNYWIQKHNSSQNRV